MRWRGGEYYNGKTSSVAGAHWDVHVHYVIPVKKEREDFYHGQALRLPVVLLWY